MFLYMNVFSLINQGSYPVKLKFHEDLGHFMKKNEVNVNELEKSRINFNMNRSLRRLGIK